MTTTLEDWYVEAGDPDVGIFGELVQHIGCGTEELAFVAETNVRSTDHGTVVITDVWECGECPARIGFDSEQPA